uniref:Large ribosomal subunit protein bL20c n=2 Tax=Prototheca wickerhamii TaxID=3111 RepID=RK20_PROWI|nr:RecName: Full=Large ribosomal subunit protein bL20c; AltName: Full=50S ribosomal protein L20, plastid [Prototheca wickerhamii]AHK09991.1 ribosomal protein L20 [Prototheca wickerhamii]CAB53110.1 50S ribosomal protein L20 [Prototheca wickerhamii]
MTRVKRGNIARNRRNEILDLAKGFRGSSSKLYRTAQQRTIKALTNSYKDRKNKKREFVKIWVSRINAAVRLSGLNYSSFQNQLKFHKIRLNRKICSQIALQDQESFTKLLDLII